MAMACCLALLLVSTSVAAAATRSRKRATAATAGAVQVSRHPAGAPLPRLTAPAAILIDPSTGQELYGHNVNQELPIASTTKLMTALVTLQHETQLSRIFTAPNYYLAPGDSQIGLVPGERMSIHDLLLAMMLPSADDAAEDLAYNVGHHSVARFVAMMNAEADRLGLRRTHYSTPIGFDVPGNYSTAGDLVALANYDLSHFPFFARIVALPRAVLRTGSHVRAVVNLNDLVSRFDWIDGVKTGHTSGAGYVLVASGHRHGMTLMSAVLGTSSAAARDANTLALLRYGFAKFRVAHPVAAGEVMAMPTVRYRPHEHAMLIASRPWRRAVSVGTRLRVEVLAPRRLTGPEHRGARLGTAVVLADGRPVAWIPLVLLRPLPKVSPPADMAWTIVRSLVLVALFAALVVGALAFLARRRRRDRAAIRSMESA
jgi:D-alanyl-D-alanine carboxypeptidase (penicillin-binding protein 5/6)